MFARPKYLEPNDKKSWENIEDPVGTVKYDGGSYFASVDSSGKLRFVSRRPSVKGGYPDRTSALPHLTDKSIPEFAGTILNGEIIHTGFNKNEVEKHSVASGILNSLPPKAIETQGLIGPLRYVIHDVVNPPLQTYGQKLEHMRKIEAALGKPDLIFVPQIASGHEAINSLIRRTKERGQEGVIITSLTKPEQDNNRFKVKHKITHNLIVSDIIQEVDKDGTPKPSMGALVLKDASGKEVGKVGTGFSKADREDAWNNKRNWLGRAIQVTSFGFAVNALRMGVYNGDADGDIDTVS